MKRMSVILILLVFCLIFLPACTGSNQADGNRVLDTTQEGTNLEEVSMEKQLEFERKYSEIVKDILRQHFPKKVKASETTERVIIDMEKLNEFGTFYLDSKSPDNLKYVFLVDNEDANEIKEIKADLESALGQYVEFRKSKHDQKMLKTVQKEIADMLLEKKIMGGWGVGVDVWKEKVVVEAYLDETIKSELIQKYGADIVEVQMQNTSIGLAGYVIDKKEGEILVVNPHKKQNELQYPATWFSNAPSHIEIGNRVEVYVINGPRQLVARYPDIDVAHEVKVIKLKLTGSELAEFEAIRNAVLSRLNQSVVESK